MDVNLRKIQADVDGAGRADVGDLVEGAHQLVVGGRDQGLVQQKIGDITNIQIVEHKQ